MGIYNVGMISDARLSRAERPRNAHSPWSCWTMNKTVRLASVVSSIESPSRIYCPPGPRCKALEYKARHDSGHDMGDIERRLPCVLDIKAPCTNQKQAALSLTLANAMRKQLL